MFDSRDESVISKFEQAGGLFMKRRLWIAAMALFVVSLGSAEPARATLRNAHSCIKYSCQDATGCDPFCNCQDVGHGSTGTCGNPG